MYTRIGKVTNVYPSVGKVKVLYEDENNASLPLSMLTMNGEYSMPREGDRVVTIHMENGSSKGFVLGTYYGGATQPKADSGYRKDLEGGAYVLCQGGVYQLAASRVVLSASNAEAELALGDETVIKADSVTVQADDITLECAYGTVTVEELLKRLERMEDSLGLQHTI